MKRRELDVQAKEVSVKRTSNATTSNMDTLIADIVIELSGDAMIAGCAV